MDLTDQQTQDELMSHVESHGTFAEFAELHKVGRKTIGRQLKKLPELARALEVARVRAKAETKRAPTGLSATAPSSDGVLPGFPTLERWRAWLWEMASDEGVGEVPPVLRSKCTDIMAQIIEAPELYRVKLAAQHHATQLEADSGAKDTRPVIIRHGTPPPRVVDAELVERPPRLDS